MEKTKGKMKVSAVSIKIGLHAKTNQTGEKKKKKEEPDISNLYTKIKQRKTMRNLLKKKK